MAMLALPEAAGAACSQVFDMSMSYSFGEPAGGSEYGTTGMACLHLHWNV